MIKCLVIVGTKFGYDGITNVVRNYYLYQDHSQIKMDILTINPVDEELQKDMEMHGDTNYVVECRNSNPFKYVAAVCKIAKKGKYDIVHAHGGSCTLAVEMVAAMLAGVKVRIAHSHSTYSDFGRINTLLKPVFFAAYTHGFACGKEAGEWLFGKRKFHIISNGVDVEKYAYSEENRKRIREKYELNNQMVYGHIGRFNVQKNHKKLVEIYESISKRQENPVLVMIGDGELRAETEALTAKKNLNVKYIGLSDEIPAWLSAMDIMLLPSLYEGLPLVIVEAQAACLPCYLSDTVSEMTAITELVKFVPLEAEGDVWAEVACKPAVLNRSEIVEQIKMDIIRNNYDIRENCRQLIKIYGGMLCR